MENGTGIERRKGRRETDLALLAHLADILADEPDAVFAHAPIVIERMAPSAWAWVTPEGETFGKYDSFDREKAFTEKNDLITADACSWLTPAEGIVFRKCWADREFFVFSRPAEVAGAERWEAFLVRSVASLLRGARRAAETLRARPLAFYGSAEAETLRLLDTELRRTLSLNLPLSAAFFRLDGVSNINRSEGLAAGDRAFVRFADLVRANGASDALFGRAGTTGLLVIFPAQGRGTTEDWLEGVCGRLEEKLREETRCRELSIRATIAEAPGDARTAEELARAVGMVLKC